MVSSRDGVIARVRRLEWLLSKGKGTGSLRGAPRARCLEESRHGKRSRFGCWSEEERVVRGVARRDLDKDAEPSSDGDEPVGDRRLAGLAGSGPSWAGGGSTVVMVGARTGEARPERDGDGDAPSAGLRVLQQGQDRQAGPPGDRRGSGSGL